MNLEFNCGSFSDVEVGSCGVNRPQGGNVVLEAGTEGKVEAVDVEASCQVVRVDPRG
jgi:hypothetical protein